jgi:hypothetical protein
MITTSTYLVVCLVAVSLFTIVAIGELGNKGGEPEPSEDSEAPDSDGGKIVVRSHLRSRR